MKIQLGFAQELEDGIVEEEIGHRSPDWSLWDGGKIGGVPSWLNPRDIPTEPIYCSDEKCKTKMKFIAQLYCPLDEDEDEDNDAENAFHRSLYVFACPNNKYHENKQSGGCGGGVRVLRCQLPRLNPFYPYDTPDETESDDGDDDDEKREKKIESVNHLSKDGWNVNLCFVCGQRAKGKCPKAQKWFCSKDCQKEFYKFGESNSNNMNNNNKDSLHNFPSIYKEMELVVEEEPPPISSLNGNLKNLTIEEVQEKALFQDDSTTNSNQKKKSTGEKEQEEEETLLDEDLEQEDLNKMTGGETHKGMTDPMTLAFFSRIDRETVDTDTDTPTPVKDQCLRYQRWPDSYCDDTSNKDNDDVEEEEIIYPELWISSQHQQPQGQIPDCQYCGAPRKYEFQIMPQMLNYLTRCEGGGRTTTTPSSKETNKNNNNNSQNEEAKQAILAACQIREKHGDENIPSEFLQKHDEALEKMKNELLGSSNKNDGKSGSNDTTSMDWGVIAVYTCTKSCNSLCSSATGTDTSKATTSNAYLEEYAWRQPPLG